MHSTIARDNPDHLDLVLHNHPVLALTIVTILSIPLSLLIGRRSTRRAVIGWIVVNSCYGGTTAMLWLVAHQPVVAHLTILTGISTLLLICCLFVRASEAEDQQRWGQRHAYRGFDQVD